MDKTSLIIPARNEKYLTKTIDNIFSNATNEIEVIVILDGPTQYPIPKERPNLIIKQFENPFGMRNAINTGVEIASGKYLMKLDAHVAVGYAFDEILKMDCDKDWIVTCRRYELDFINWIPKNQESVDYFYMSCPWNHPKMFLIQSCPWVGRTRKNSMFSIDEQMTMHGAMWFMHKEYFDRQFGKMDNDGYGGFAAEPLELGMKCWLGGGKMMVNKNTWYAHPHYNKEERAGYSVRSTRMFEGLIWAAHYWTEDRWEKRIHNFDWLIDKFWPLPFENTRFYGEKYYWPEDWRNYCG